MQNNQLRTKSYVELEDLNSKVLLDHFSWSDTYILIGVWLGEDQRTNTIKTQI